MNIICINGDSFPKGVGVNYDSLSVLVTFALLLWY